MRFYKKAFSVALASVCMAPVFAQSGTNSPYSQYGLGQMAEQSSGFNRGMNGLGLGFREHNQVNYLNPASYSSMDSLTFIFDAGLSGQVTNFNENGTKVNANNADFEYAVAGFRAFKHLGVSFGILPYSNVGYNYAIADYLNGDRTSTYTNTYNGSGGIHQAYFGAGWEMFKGFSVGANIAYLWGEINRSVVNSYSNSNVNTLSKYYSATVNSYKLDFGVQYELPLNKKNTLTLGATYSLGHELSCTPTCEVISTNSTTGVADTTSYSVKNGFEIPMQLAAGMMWNHNEKLKLGADFQYQKWGDCQFPVYQVLNDKPQYSLSNNYYSDRYKVTFGGEFCSNPTSRRFINRVRFRAGASYASPYLNINGQDGPKEISVSAGFGIPIMNNYNNRSILNISGQWVQTSGKGMLKENTFRINIGMTFNERWFMKWKVD